MARRRAKRREPRRQPVARLAPQLLRLVARMRAGRIGCPGQRPEGAAARDLGGVGDGLGQVGEQRRHLGAGLEIMIGGETAAVSRRR